MNRSVRGRGFTLVELLVVVTIIGILSMLAVDAFLNSIQRARQSRTVNDMRTVATGLEAYHIDIGRYPPSAGYSLPSGLPLPTKGLSAVVPYLQPTYIRVVPAVDGWSSWFTFSTDTDLGQYGLRSMGKGGVPDSAMVYGPTTGFEADILIVSGVFVQYPEGIQR